MGKTSGGLRNCAGAGAIPIAHPRMLNGYAKGGVEVVNSKGLGCVDGQTSSGRGLRNGPWMAMLELVRNPFRDAQTVKEPNSMLRWSNGRLAMQGRNRKRVKNDKSVKALGVIIFDQVKIGRVIPLNRRLAQPGARLLLQGIAGCLFECTCVDAATTTNVIWLV